MSLTDPALLWLVEATVYDPYLPGLRVLRYASHQGFVTGPAETPANTVYDARILQAASMRRDLFDQGTTQGHTRIGFGELVLENSDGLLDALLQYGFDGQPITIRLGQPGAAYPGGFSTFLVATMEQCEVSASRVTIRLRDRQQEMDIPLQTQKYGGTNALPDGVDGVATDLKGKPKPVMYGKGLNIPAACVNTSKQIYQVSDLQIASVDAVYDRGVSLTPGFSFSAIASPPTSTPSGLAYGNGMWVQSTGPGGAPGIWSSPDGVNWTSRVSGLPGGVRQVVFANGIFMAVGTSAGCSTSPDGITWTLQTVTTWGAGRPIVCAAWGNPSGTANGIWIVGGDQDNGANSQIAYSTNNGVTWTLQTLTTGVGVVFYGLAYGNGLFVMVGDPSPSGSNNPGSILTTTNGTAWTVVAHAFPPGVSICGVAFGNSTFVAWAPAATGISSSGTSWTISRPTALATLGISLGSESAAVTFGNGLFALSGQNGTKPSIAFSADGASWVVVDLTSVAVSGLIYGCVFGASFFVALTSSGKTLTGGVNVYASLSELYDDSQMPPPSGYRAYPGGGYFRLGVAPTGLVTADVTEGATAADRTAAQIFKRVLMRAGKTSADWSAADLTALDAANSAVLGFWSMQEITVAAVLDKVAASVGAWWGVDRTGVFRIKQFTEPSGTPVASYTANDLEMGLNRQPTGDGDAGIPIYRAVVRHSRVYAVQTSDLAGAVTQARRNLVGLEWREAIATDTDVQRVHVLAPQQVDDSLLTSEADASFEAARRLALRKVRRDVFDLLVEASPANVAVDLGDVVRLTHSRYGLTGGLLFRVIGIEPNPANRTIRQTVWGSITSGAVPPAVSTLFYRGTNGDRRGPRFTRHPSQRKVS